MIDLALYDAPQVDWHQPPEPPAAGQVHLWYWTLDAADDDWQGWLDTQEAEHHARLATEQLKQHYVAAHGGLRKLLACYLGTTPNAVPIERGPHGKPHLEDAGLADLQLEFNLSHSAGHVVAAVSEQPVGIDIEVLRPVSNLRTLAGKHFTELELERLDALEGDGAPAYFFRTWTRKEAVAKLTGLGLTAAVDTLETGEQPAGGITLPGNWGTPLTECWLADLAAHTATRAALATAAEPSETMCFRIPQ